MRIFDVIKYEGDNTKLIWKYPGEDFNTHSKLIVNETQEAILFYNGQALDKYPPGQYVLHTGNIPLLRKITEIPTDGVSPFHCTVYYISKIEQMSLNWGVGDVIYNDPVHNNYPFKIKANGVMNLSVTDSRRLLLKLVGTGTQLETSQLADYFRGPITTYIKTYLPRTLKEKNTPIYEVEGELSELSEMMRERITTEMEDYGVTLEKFWINNIVKPEDDEVYKKLRRLRGDQMTVIGQKELDLKSAEYDARIGVITHAGEDQKRRIDIETDKYEKEIILDLEKRRREFEAITSIQEHQFDVLKTVASNTGSGRDLSNAAINVMTGLAAGGVIKNTFNNAMNNTPVFQPTQAEAPAQDSFETRVAKLKTLHDAGLLSDEEFTAARNELVREVLGK